ncbi:hypothetical protein L1987_05351 [Smallanthus sonchifolius]|uniref:Uncharacterized protein n=1 Tax=Smallanthus sonchifolius TaxID=185202 RepID=A0ACB9JV41_9ASTR|nr:hypothetical protein L1987_05351 [Smallanthus sonchifolius]
MQASTINLSTNPSLMEPIVPHTSQMQPDYLDNLLPGYRFCPTDSELILYYLKQKIETGEHPKCRIYEVNLYNHSPEQLTRRRRSLAYYDEKGLKTPFLMHEYTMDDPNLPIQSGQYGNKVLTDWVLCTIYKKKSSNRVEAPHHVFAREEGEYQQNHSIFQFSNGASSSTSFEPHTHHVAPPPAYTSLLSSRGVRLDASEDLSQQNQSMLIATKSFQFADGASSSISVESPADVPVDDGDNLDFDVS